MKKLWKKLSKITKYDNPWIRVEHHEVTNPAGLPGIYGTVHFKNLAIGIIPFDNNGNTWIVGQHRFPLDEYSWEIPEGGGKIGQDPIAAAQRELKEETGIVAKKWTEILRINTSNSVTDELGIIYLAQDLEFFEANPDEDEDLKIRKLPFDVLFQEVMDGKMKDSLTLAGVLKLQHLLKEKKVKR